MKNRFRILSVVVIIAVFLINMFANMFETLSLALIIFGSWILILAGIRAVNPEQYGRGTFNIFSVGILLTTFGIIREVYVRALFVEWLLPAFLLTVGILVVVAGIREWRK